MKHAIILAGLAVASARPIHRSLFNNIITSQEVPDQIFVSSTYVSGGAIAGITIGLLIVTAMAGVLAYLWRSVRHDYMSPFDPCAEAGHAAPTRTVVTEKIEPVVVRTTSNGGQHPVEDAQILHGAPVPPPIPPHAQAQ